MLGSARWVSHIVQTVKKSDKMVAAVARIAFGAGDLKRDLVEKSISAGNMASVFNGTTVIIETEEARFRERPRHQHCGSTMAAPHVGNYGARSQLCLNTL